MDANRASGTGRPHARRRAFLAAIAATALTMIPTACGGSGGTADDGPSIAGDNPYAAEFTKHYAAAANPLVKGILKDGVITESEMNEFAGAFSSCMTGKGVGWSWSAEGGESITLGRQSNLTMEQVDRIQNECHDETDYFHIMPLYDFVSANPDNLGADQVNMAILECLKSNDLIDQTMDPEYFLSFYSDPDSAEYQRYLGPLEDEQNPGYSKARSEQFTQCVQNPLKTAK